MKRRTIVRLVAGAVVSLSIVGVATWWTISFQQVWPFLEGTEKACRRFVSPGAVLTGYHTLIVPTQLVCDVKYGPPIVATPAETVITLTALFVASVLAALAGIIAMVASWVSHTTNRQ